MLLVNSIPAHLLVTNGYHCLQMLYFNLIILHFKVTATCINCNIIYTTVRGDKAVKGLEK